MQPGKSEIEAVQLRAQVETLHQLLEVQERVVQSQSARLRQSEARFRALSSSAPIGILQVDASGGCLYANPRADEICRGALATLIGQVWLEIIDPNDRVAVEKAWGTLAEAQLMHSMEFRIRNSSGSPCWVTARSTRFQVPHDPTTGFVITLEDITERKQAALELEKLHRSLAETSRKAGMAEVASGVLHNIGNVLNSLNVSVAILDDMVKKSKISAVEKLAGLLQEHSADLSEFLTVDPRGRVIPGFTAGLAHQLSGERDRVLAELGSIARNVDHIKSIVSVQQSYTGVWGASETVEVKDLIEDALAISISSFERHGVTIVREYEAFPTIETDKHKAFQILVNILANARQALKDGGTSSKELRIRLLTLPGGTARIELQDSGIGIRPEHLGRMFTLGFTTRKDGHGLGLHGSAIAVKQLGGTISVQSDGPDRGAVFVLELPLVAPAI